MTKKKWLLTLSCLSVACAGTLVLAACGQGGGSSYKDGDVIVGHREIEWEENVDGSTVRRYTDDEYEIIYLSGNRSYITLEGSKLSEMAVTGYQGDVQTFSLADIESIKVEDQSVSVNAVADGAFMNCKTLTEVDLTKKNASLTFTIGDAAFAGCESLASITVPGAGETSVYSNGNSIGDYAFAQTALTAFTMDDTYNFLGAGAFMNCEALANIELPDALTSIEAHTFEGCTSLTAFTFPATVEHIGDYAFSGAPVAAFDLSAMPELSAIGEYAFANNTALRSIAIPATVERLGDHLLYNDANLGSLSIARYTYDAAQPGEPVTPANITASVIGLFGGDTGAEGFYDNGEGVAVPEALTSVTVNEMRTVPQKFLYGMSSLTSANISLNAALLVNNEQAGIGNYAFYGCENLGTGLSVRGSYAAIGSHAFDGTALTQFSVPSSVERIGDHAFANTGLTSFTVPDSVTYLGANIFYNASAMNSLTVERFMIPAYDEQTGEALLPTALFDKVSSLFGATTYDATDGTLRPVSSLFYIAENSVAVPKALESVTVDEMAYVPDSFLHDLSSLRSATLRIPATYEEIWEIAPVIGDSAFAGCTALADLTIDGTYNAIGERAFEGMAFTQFSVPSSVESIGDYAFADTKLASFTVPGSVTYLGRNIFYNAAQLSSLTIERMSYYDAELETVQTLTNDFGALFGATHLQTWLEENPGLDEDDYPFYNRNLYGSSVWIPDALTEVTVRGMQNVPTGFLRDMISLKKVTIGINANLSENGVAVTIGSNAFNGCTALTDLTIDGEYTNVGTYAFANTQITSFTFPESVETVENYVFYNVSTLTELTVDRYTHSEYSYGRYNYTNAFATLGSIFGGPDETAWVNANPGKEASDYPFYETSTGNILPKAFVTLTMKGIHDIPANFARNAASLKTLSLEFNDATPESGSIGNYAFADCSDLATITLTGTDLEELGAYAFQKTAITSFTLPESVATVGEGILNGTHVTEITLEDASVLGEYGMLRLFGTENPDAATGDGYGTFYKVSANSTYYYVPESFTKLTLTTDSLVPDYFAYGMTSLTDVTVTFESNVYRNDRGFGVSAFENCTNLATVAVTGDYESIRERAFCGCESLTAIDIPDSVTSIGEEAFRGCSKLSVDALPAELATLGADAFDGCLSLVYDNGVAVLDGFILSFDPTKDVVILPAGVTNAAEGLFSAGSGFPEVYYTLGTEDDWALLYSNASGIGSAPDGYLTAENYTEVNGVHFLLTAETTEPDGAEVLKAYVIDVDSGLTVAEISASVTLGEKEYTVVGLKDYSLRSDALSVVIIEDNAALVDEECGINVKDGALRVYYKGTQANYNLNATLPVGVSGKYEFADTDVTYTFMKDGTETYLTQTAALATMPEAPEKDGYRFLGWYTDATAGTQVYFPYLSESEDDRIFYAHWEAVPDEVTEDDVTFDSSSYTRWTLNPSNTSLKTSITYNSNNAGSGTYTLTLTAKRDMTISFDYRVSYALSTDSYSYFLIRDGQDSQIARITADNLQEEMHMEVTLKAGTAIDFVGYSRNSYTSFTVEISDITYTLA